ncbi:MAG: hypothetical protein QGG71_26585 [Pirellulaceae bacterium]|jgi:hypothetical protein|nr:hypothetical protein [Planctomycetota bacterium]MDP6558259.1 hypothetical protein [Pirellulaceae bacterium]
MATKDQLINAREAALRILWDAHGLIRDAHEVPEPEIVTEVPHEVDELSQQVISFRDMLLECSPIVDAVSDSVVSSHAPLRHENWVENSAMAIMPRWGNAIWSGIAATTGCWLREGSDAIEFDHLHKHLDAVRSEILAHEQIDAMYFDRLIRLETKHALAQQQPVTSDVLLRLDTKDISILQAIYKTPGIKLADLEADRKVDISRKKVGERCAALRELDLTERMRGERGGEFITELGKNALSASKVTRN